MIAKLTSLNSTQKEKLVGLVLTDSYLEHNKSSGNTRFGFNQVDRHSDFFMQVKNDFNSHLTPNFQAKTNVKDFELKKRPGQLQLRTRYDKVFNPFYDLFYPNEGPKQVPQVSVLEPYITWQTLAYMLMADGSVKGSAGYSRVLNVHAFSYESSCRLAVTLHKKLGIYTKVIRKQPSSQSKYNDFWPIYISGSSSSLLTQNLTSLICPSFSYKVPPIRRTKAQNVLTSSSAKWLKEVENEPFLEDLSIVVPDNDRIF